MSKVKDTKIVHLADDIQKVQVFQQTRQQKTTDENKVNCWEALKLSCLYGAKAEKS